MLVFLRAAPAWSQEGPDTTGRVYEMGEVLVQASRLVSPVLSAYQPLTVIDPRNYAFAGNETVAGMLKFVPGLFVKDYGSSAGLKLLQLRGTSSSQAVVLVDGMPYQSAQNGTVDLSAFTGDEIERLEVLRGGNTAALGSGAIGGAVNIVTRRPRPGAYRARIGGGSFGSWHADASGAFALGSMLAHGGVSREYTRGDFPFPYDAFGRVTTARRENNDYARTTLYAGLYLDDPAQVRLRARGMQRHRGVPGAVVQGAPTSQRASIDEGDLFVTGEAAWNGSDMRQRLALGLRANSLRYDDGRQAPRVYAYFNRQLNLDWKGVYLVGSTLIEANTSGSLADLRGDNLDVSSGDVRRLAGSAWIRVERVFRQASVPLVMIEGTIRGETYSDQPSALSWSAGGSVTPIEDVPWRLRAFVSSNYRVPSFNEQYYRNFGNRELAPERSLNFDLGATLSLKSLQVEAGWFFITTRNRIIAVPRSPVEWSAKNVGRAQSTGFEARVVAAMFGEAVRVSGNYTRLRATDRTTGGLHSGKLLPYSPEELVSALVRFRKGVVELGASFQRVSHQYALSSNIPESLVPSYYTVDCFAALDVMVEGMWLSLRADVVNLTDESYEIVKNFPLPGRRYSFELHVSSK